MALTSSEIDHIFQVLGGWLSGFRVLRSVRKRVKGAGPMLNVKQDDHDYIQDASEQFKKVSRLKRGDAYNLDDIIHLDIEDTCPGTKFSLDWIFVDDQGNETILATASGDYDTFVDLNAQDPDGVTGKIKIKAPTGGPTGKKRVKLSVFSTAIRAIEDATGLSSGELDARNQSSVVLNSIGDNFEEDEVSGQEFGPLWERYLEEAFENQVIPWIAEQIGSSEDEALRKDIQASSNGRVTILKEGVLPDLNNTLANNSETVEKNTVSHTTPTISGSGDGSFSISLKQSAVPGTVTLTCTRGWSDSDVNDPEEFKASVASDKLNFSRSGERPIRIFHEWESMALGIDKLKITRKTNVKNDSESRFSNVKLEEVNKSNIDNKSVEAKIDTTNNEINFRVNSTSSSADLTIDIPSDGETVTVEIGSNGVKLTFTYSTGSSDDSVDFEVVPFETGDTIEFDISNDLASRFNTELLRLYEFAFDQVDSSPTLEERHLIKETEVVSPDVGVTN